MSTIEKLIERGFWSLFLGVVTFGVSFLKDLNTNVSELNNKMAIVLVMQSESKEVIDSLVERVTHLEKARR